MKKRIILVFSVILVTYMLTIYAPDAIKAWILHPVMVLLQKSKELFYALDQSLVWFFVWSALGIVIGRHFIPKGIIFRHTVSNEEHMNRQNWIRIWKRHLYESSKHGYIKWRGAQSLYNILIEALAYKTGLEQNKVVPMILRHETDLPEDIRLFVNYARTPYQNKQRRGFARLFKSSSNPDIDVPPERIIAFIEGSINKDTGSKPNNPRTERLVL